jgi:hypothetical protein
MSSAAPATVTAAELEHQVGGAVLVLVAAEQPGRRSTTSK